MKWRDVFGWSRQGEVLATLESVKVTAERIETQLAESRSLSAETSALANSLRAVLDKASQAPSRKSIVRLLAVTFAFIFGGFGVTVWGLAGFADPAPDYPQYGSAQIFIQTSDQNEMANVADATARVIYYPEFDHAATYTFLVPRRFAGRRFFVALDTSATLRKVKANFTIIWNFTSSRCPNGDDQPTTGLGTRRRCQLIAGIVPQTADTTTTVQCSTGIESEGAVPIEVSGQGRFETHSDWAHRQIEIPDSLGWYRQQLTSVWGGQQLGATFATPSPQSCAMVVMRKNYSVASVSALGGSPKAGDGSTVLWENGASNTGATFTTRSAYTGGLANLIVATGAAIAAVGIGFVPALYDKVSRYRSASADSLPTHSSGNNGDLPGPDEAGG